MNCGSKHSQLEQTETHICTMGTHNIPSFLGVIINPYIGGLKPAFFHGVFGVQGYSMFVGGN